MLILALEMFIRDMHQRYIEREMALPKRECRISMAAAVCVHLVNSPTFRYTDSGPDSTSVVTVPWSTRPQARAEAAL